MRLIILVILISTIQKHPYTAYTFIFQICDIYF